MEIQEDVKKSPEVDIDTDGVKEESIEVEEQKVETSETELPKHEVDLGYTEPKPEGIEGIKVETVKEEETKPEVKEENLSEVSEKVQRRINKLTFKVRESERREKAALDYAKSLQKKLDDTQSRFSKTSKSYIEQFSARVTAEQEDAKKALRDAIAEQDADKIADANSRIAQLAVEAEKVKITQAEEDAKQEKAKVEQPIQQAPQQTTQQEPSPKAKGWAEKNEWFGSDKIMTSAAFQAHNDLVEQGFDAESDEYYNEIDKVMRENFPHKFNQQQEQKKPVQTVASAQRNQSGRRSVKLTKSQIVIAKKLGVPLEEYAKYVKENANG
jgi:hypothetical protein|tara:strand:+ start:1355 stop:2335 length:981 start_codon:yes stop_codon:yes gene_type:complete